MEEEKFRDEKGRIMKGSKLPKWFRDKISKANMGREVSQETKNKISIGHKGKKLSESHKLKMREAKLGKTLTEEHKKKIKEKMIDWWDKNKNTEKTRMMAIKIGNKIKGRKLSKDHIAKIVKTRREKDSYKMSEENKRKLIEINTARKCSEETKRKIGKGNKGKVSWMKGLTKETDERIMKIAKKRKGFRHSEYTKKLMSIKQKGHLRTKGSFTKESRAKIILPKKDSTIEIKIQNFLKQLEIEFYTHQYMKINHGYQCDILIPSMNLIIECDGIYWHKYPIGREIDIIRTQELLDEGFKVLRFWETEIKTITLPEFKYKLEQINGT